MQRLKSFRVKTTAHSMLQTSNQNQTRTMINRWTHFGHSNHCSILSRKIRYSGFDFSDWSIKNLQLIRALHHSVEFFCREILFIESSPVKAKLWTECNSAKRYVGFEPKCSLRSYDNKNILVANWRTLIPLPTLTGQSTLDWLSRQSK